MEFLKAFIVILIFVSNINAQFNEYKYVDENSDSIVTKKDPIAINTTIVQRKIKVSNYVSNFLFAGSGLKTNKIRSSVYKSFDIIFIVGAVASYYQSNQAVDTYKSFAVDHSNVYPNSEEFVNALSARSLRNNKGEDGYNTFYFKKGDYSNMIDEVDDNIWLWDEEKNLNKYKTLVSDEKKYTNQMYMFVGGLLLNRIVSTIDIAISAKKMKLVPEASSSSVGLKIQGNI